MKATLFKNVLFSYGIVIGGVTFGSLLARALGLV